MPIGIRLDGCIPCFGRLLREVMSILIETGTLPSHYHPHKLKGKKGNTTWECHIQPNWLLVWEQHDEELIMLMLDTGTHSDIF